MRFSFFTLGCKVNQYETQAMQQHVTALGHTLVPFGEACDCCVVNTCTVTAVSDKKCRNAIRRAKKSGAAVGVCGCYSQTKPEEIRALGADVLAGTADRIAFLDSLIATAQDRKKREHYEPAREHRTFEQLPAGGMAERTRAMLKVEDGCNNYCTYCMIPYARGPVRSLSLESAVAETKRCVADGYREIIVTGIEISSWSDGEKKLVDLLEAVCDAAGEMRVRLGSLEPRTVDEAFCARLKDKPNLCPQFHLSLQSGCDRVLARMHRKYDTARYLESVRLLRQSFPDCAITTDVIGGFPGETEEDWAQTLDFLKKCDFAACHIFPYSRRKGTLADAYPDQILTAVKVARCAQAAEIAEMSERAYLQKQIGTVQRVLWEQIEDGYFAGHAPNYVKVYAKGENLHNTVTDCRITALFRDGVLGEIE